MLQFLLNFLHFQCAGNKISNLIYRHFALNFKQSLKECGRNVNGIILEQIINLYFFIYRVVSVFFLCVLVLLGFGEFNSQNFTPKKEKSTSGKVFS